MKTRKSSMNSPPTTSAAKRRQDSAALSGDEAAATKNFNAFTPSRKRTPTLDTANRDKSNPNTSKTDHKSSGLSPIKSEPSPLRPSPRAATKATENAARQESILDEHGVPDLSKAPDQWAGWCEIESDPALFNVVMKDWGVRGVKAYQILSLEEDMLAQIPTPVFGLIFLFRWMEYGDEGQTEDANLGSGKGVWFANQVVDNACASIALLNILMNATQEVDVGEHLTQFREFTQDMTPPTRGQAIDNFQFIKDVHNSFGRKLDMLASDFEFANKADATSKRASKRRRTSDEAALHFNAFVPFEGELFKLDGLEGSPCNLGPLTSENWLLDVRSTLEDRMNACQANANQTNSYEFAILALTRDPLPGLHQALHDTEKRLEAILDYASELAPQWTRLNGLSPTEAMLLAEQQSNIASLEPSGRTDAEKFKDVMSSDSLPKVLAYQRKLQQTSQDLGGHVAAEELSNFDDAKKAQHCRFDYEPAIRHWISCLARKGRLKELLDLADEEERERQMLISSGA